MSPDLLARVRALALAEMDEARAERVVASVASAWDLLGYSEKDGPEERESAGWILAGVLACERGRACEAQRRRVRMVVIDGGSDGSS